MLSSRILKGGAMLGDSRRLAEVWNPAFSAEENLRGAVEGNLLGKGSRSRALDVLAILRARFPTCQHELRHSTPSITDEGEREHS